MGLIFHKNLSRNVFIIAYPVALGMFAQTFINLLETAFVGRLGEGTEACLAAVGLGIITLWIVGGFFNSISIGTLSMAARRFGEKNEEACGRVAFNSLTLALILGAGCALGGYFVTPLVFPYLSPDPKVVARGIPFLQIRFLGLFPFLLTVSYKSFFDSLGKTKVFMVTAIIMNIVNAFLCWVLIFGYWGFPRWELKGAAAAASISSAVGTMCMFSTSLFGKYRKRFRYYHISNFDPRIMREILRISLPAGITATMTTIGFGLFLWIIGHIGTVEQAASNVTIQIASLFFLPCIGLGTASATLVGQNLGAKSPEKATSYGWEAVKLGVLIMGSAGAVAFAFPEHIIRVFTPDENVVRAGIISIRILGAFQTFQAAALIFTQSLLGAGASKFVMTVELILHYLFFVPLTYVFGIVCGLGIFGAWSAAMCYVIVLSIVMGLKFWEGGWKYIKI